MHFESLVQSAEIAVEGNRQYPQKPFLRILWKSDLRDFGQLLQFRENFPKKI
jgi:hypothetical protein